MKAVVKRIKPVRRKISRQEIDGNQCRQAGRPVCKEGSKSLRFYGNLCGQAGRPVHKERSKSLRFYGNLCGQAGCPVHKEGSTSLRFYGNLCGPRSGLPGPQQKGARVSASSVTCVRQAGRPVYKEYVLSDEPRSSYPVVYKVLPRIGKISKASEDDSAVR